MILLIYYRKMHFFRSKEVNIAEFIAIVTKLKWNLY